MRQIWSGDREAWLERRRGLLMSTDCDALLGGNKYDKSYFSLWVEKKHGLSGVVENERMRWGLMLEGVIAQAWVDSQDEGVTLERKEGEYALAWEPEARIGTSWDYIAKRGEFEHLLEIKNVDTFIFADQWGGSEEEGWRAPEHIELQLQHQLMVSGYDKIVCAALVGGNRLISLERTPDLEIHSKIREAARKFWELVDSDGKPPLDYEGGVDLTALKRLLAQVSGESKEDLSLDQYAGELREIKAQIKHLEAVKRGLETRFIEKLDGGKVLSGEKYRLTATKVAAKTVTTERKAHIRYNFKLEEQ